MKTKINIYDDKSYFYMMKGFNYSLQSFHEKAFESVLNSIKYNPDNLNAVILLGNSYLIKDEFEKALIQFDKALIKTPENYFLLSVKSLTLQELGRFDESGDILKKLIKIEPENKFIYRRLMHLVNIHLGRGGEDEVNKALEYLYTLAESNPNDYFVNIKIGMIYNNFKMYHPAIAHLSEMSKKFPNDYNINRLLIRNLMEVSKHDEAIKRIEEIINLERTGSFEKHSFEIIKTIDHALLTDYGISFEVTGKYENAIKAYLDSLNYNYKDYVTYYCQHLGEKPSPLGEDFSLIEWKDEYI